MYVHVPQCVEGRGQLCGVRKQSSTPMHNGSATDIVLR